MTEHVDEPAWLDGIPDDDLDWPTPDEIDHGRRQHANELEEQRAATHIDELARLGHPIPTNGQPATRALRDEVGAHRAQRLHAAGYPDLDDFLAGPEPEYDWLIPGLLERGDRLILTGQEGKGKTTLLRQLGVQAALGVHPFTLQPTTPRRVVYINLENGIAHERRNFKELRRQAGPDLTRGLLVPVVWPAGLDLLHRGDVTLLAQLLEVATPDLLIIGPSYKLAGGDPTSEETARGVTRVLDRLREQHRFALILEAHQPYAPPGTSRRVERPYGASLWSRWPEFGLHLGDEGQLRHWRGARDERDWPKALERGIDWPWVSIADVRKVTFGRILEEIRDAGRELTRRELSDRIGGHHSTITRAIEANRDQYDRVIASLQDETF